MAIFSTDGNPSSKFAERRHKLSKTNRRPSPKKWQTHRELIKYSSKLIETLHRIRRATPPSEAPRRSRTIREAADRILAISGRGQTRWSRAILSSRNLKLKPRRPLKAICLSAQPKKKRSPQFLKCKARILGSLIPGCRRLSFSNLVEEASDYVAALEMQVRAMASLTAFLSASGGFSEP